MSLENFQLAVADAKFTETTHPERGQGKATQSHFGDDCYTVSVLRVHPVQCETQVATTETPEDTCYKCQADRANKQGTQPHTCYAEKRNKNRVTCEALFCRDDNKDTDGFSRTIAVRYLSKRMVYNVRSNAKGKEDAPLTVKARKTSSSRHAVPHYAASDVEDIVQAAFILWLVGQSEGKYNTGNRLFDTCNACRDAKNQLTRARHKERKGLDNVALRAQRIADKERGYANRYYDAELEQLLDAVRVHGCANQRDLAVALGISPGEVCKRLSRLRERCERMER